jgi:hypothetical protein
VNNDELETTSNETDYLRYYTSILMEVNSTEETHKDRSQDSRTPDQVWNPEFLILKQEVQLLHRVVQLIFAYICWQCCNNAVAKSVR